MRSSNLLFPEILLGLVNVLPNRRPMHCRSYVCRVLVTFFLSLAIGGSPSRAQVSSPDAIATAARSAFERGAFDAAISGWLDAAREFGLSGRTDAEIDMLIRAAEAYQNIGLFAEALSTLNAARDLNREAPNAARVKILGTAGSIYLAEGSNRQAEEALTTASDLARRLGDEPLSAFIENNRGKLFAARAEYDDAIASYQDSARMARNNLLPALAARALSNAATLACRTGLLGECANFQLEALEVVGTLGDSHAKAQLLVSLGLHYAPLVEGFSERRSELLLRSYEAFTEAAEVAEAIGDHRTASYALGGLGGLYEIEGRPQEALELTRRALSDAQQIDAPESLYRWQWQAARLLRALGEDDQAIESYRASIVTLQSIRQEAPEAYATTATSFRESAGRAYFEMIDLLLERAASIPDEEDAAPYLAEAREIVELFKLAELRDYFRDDCVDTYLARETGLDDVAADAAIIYPIILPDRLELLLGIGSRLSRVTVPVREEALTNLVRVFRLLLESRTPNAYLAPAEQLYEWLIRPLDPQLESAGVETLVFVPDGPLRTIPMAALHDGSEFVIAKYAVAITPSLSLSDPRPMERDNISVLTVGLTEAVQNFAALPSVAAEVEAISELYPGASLLDERFVVDNLERELAETEFSIVHVASHAAFAGNPEDSFLLTYDDRLTLDDLGDLLGRFRLRENPIELLTLSACESASGDDRAALGLAGVAVKAGAKSALATLWQISDEATSELIARFYRELGDPSGTKAKALRQAQLDLLADPRYEHPFFWSAFILINNWL